MPSEQSPAFSFYAKDFMLGTVTMSLAERGAYITLLAYQWDRGHVPSGPVELGRVWGCSSGLAAKLWKVVKVKFDVGDDGLWRNHRLEVERQKQVAYRQLQSERGKASAANRRPTEPQASRNRASTSRESQPEANFPFPSPSPTPVEEKTNTAAAPPRAPKFPHHAAQPSDDGNFSVILKLAHETMDVSGLLDPSDPELLAQLKDACARAHIDYGRDVDPDICTRALKSAARARSAMVPGRKANGRLSGLVAELQDAPDPETMGERLRAIAERRR